MPAASSMRISTKYPAGSMARCCRSSMRFPLLKLRIWRDGKSYQIEFKHGVPMRRWRSPADGRRGTEVHFMASADTFSNIEFHTKSWPSDCASFVLNHGVKIELSTSAPARARISPSSVA